MPLVEATETCTGCGLCVQACSPGCLALEAGRPLAVRPEACILCGHCVALCPVDALRHRDLNPAGFAPLRPEAVPSPEALREFLRWRRSVRVYRDDPVPRSLVEDLLEVARYAPTAHNAQNVQFLVVDDRACLRDLARLTVDCYRKILGQLRNPLIRAVLAPVVGREVAQRALEDVSDFQRLVDRWRAGQDPIFRNAPVLLVAHAEKADYFGRDNCLFATYNVMLEAVTRGLGTCLIGYFIAAWDRDRRVREALGLPEGQRAYAACTLGYPAVRYRKAVPRRPVAVAWRPVEGA
ncbi:MAG: nitroreductase family protein [Anaerolineae bacterium]